MASSRAAGFGARAARSAAAPTAYIVSGYGLYHLQLREESPTQLIPLAVAKSHYKVVSKFRFLRSSEDPEQTPELKELRSATSIYNTAVRWSMDSDTLRKHILNMATNTEFDFQNGGPERLEVVTHLINDMESWTGPSLLDAARAISVLPPSAEACSLAGIIDVEKTKMVKRTQKAQKWTRAIYGDDEPIPEKLRFEERPEIEEALTEFWRKNSVVNENAVGQMLSSVSSLLSNWTIVVPFVALSGLGVFVLLGQDGLRYCNYTASHLPGYIAHRTQLLSSDARDQLAILKQQIRSNGLAGEVEVLFQRLMNRAQSLGNSVGTLVNRDGGLENLSLQANRIGITVKNAFKTSCSYIDLSIENLREIIARGGRRGDPPMGNQPGQ